MPCPPPSGLQLCYSPFKSFPAKLLLASIVVFAKRQNGGMTKKRTTVAHLATTSLSSDHLLWPSRLHNAATRATLLPVFLVHTGYSSHLQSFDPVDTMGKPRAFLLCILFLLASVSYCLQRG